MQSAPDHGRWTGRLDGRRCVVTGAARGIGRAIADTFAAAGARLGLIDLSADVKMAADALPGDGHLTAQIDLADPAATTEGLTELIGELGGIDVLVNNAGVFELVGVLDITPLAWDRMMAVNVRSMLVTSQVAARSMIAAGHGGRIINLASMGAKKPAPNQAHYAASKAAVIALTQSLAVELGEHQITANALCPGYVLTEMGAATRTPEMVAAWSATSPLGRCAEPDDVARFALFLAGADGAYCTGQAFNVTGGMVTH